MASLCLLLSHLVAPRYPFITASLAFVHETDTHTLRGVGKRKMMLRGTIVSPTEAFRAFQHSATSMLGSSRAVRRSFERWRLSDHSPAHRVQTHTFVTVCWFTHEDTTFGRVFTLERSGDQKLALNSFALGTSGRKFSVVYCDTVIWYTTYNAAGVVNCTLLHEKCTYMAKPLGQE